MKLNTAVRGPQPVTHEGGRASRVAPVEELKRAVATCLLWEDTFYESGEDIATRICSLTSAVRPDIAAAIAIDARGRLALRHVPLLVVRELARKGGSVVGSTLASVIQRPDEITEFLAIYWKDKRQPLSAQVKKGLAAAFNKFDGFQLAKWNKEGSTVKLRDALFLCHAKPRDEKQAAAFKALIALDKTAASNTWERRYSQVGQEASQVSAPAERTKVLEEGKLATWTDMLKTNKLGGLAFLRNLRNMSEVGVEKQLIKDYAAKVNLKGILPFQYISAANHNKSLVPIIEEMMIRGLKDVQKLPGTTVLVVDVSGSMFGPKISAKSELDRFDAAAALAILLRYICENVEVYTFSNSLEQVPLYQGFALRDAMHRSQAHSGTNLKEALERLSKPNKPFDRLIVITDEQSHDGVAKPSAKNSYIVNVAPYKYGVGYGQYTHISGFSESLIDFIREFEQVSS